MTVTTPTHNKLLKLLKACWWVGVVMVTNVHKMATTTLVWTLEN